MSTEEIVPQVIDLVTRTAEHLAGDDLQKLIKLQIAFYRTVAENCQRQVQAHESLLLDLIFPDGEVGQ